jgi:hypothetical protein
MSGFTFLEYLMTVIESHRGAQRLEGILQNQEQLYINTSASTCNAGDSLSSASRFEEGQLAPSFLNALNRPESYHPIGEIFSVRPITWNANLLRAALLKTRS